MPAFVHANRSIDGKGSTHAPNNAVWIPMGSTLFQTPAMRQPFYASLSRRAAEATGRPREHRLARDRAPHQVLLGHCPVSARQLHRRPAANKAYSTSATPLPSSRARRASRPLSVDPSESIMARDYVAPVR